MRKKLAAAVAGLAAAASFGPLVSTANANHDCYGYEPFGKTFVCVVSVEPGAPSIEQGPAIPVGRVCLGELGCTQEQTVYLPDVQTNGSLVVLFYDGTCYYVQDGSYDTATAASSHDC